MEDTVMEETVCNPTDLLASFKFSGGWYDESLFSLKPFEGMGYGGVALRDITPHTPLFHIPLPYLLTPYTSNLRSNLSNAEWESIQSGWTALIFSMMYETECGESSRWAGYLRNMPRRFETPMFWSLDERRGLIGTNIEYRIGKEDAEADYHNKIIPILRAHPDIFPSTSENFTLEAYHLQGSRILSRSFTIPSIKAGGPASPSREDGLDDEDGDEDEDEDEDEEEEMAVMVPMADMLNAAFEMDNARLFGDDDDDEDLEQEEDKEVKKRFGEGYTMITTKYIKTSEQIFNTYASPPNAELLRKYGHVDTLPLPQDILSLLTQQEIGEWQFGNPGDEVEIPGDKVLKLIGGDEEEMKKRVDWWLEEGQDDTFIITYSQPIDPSLISFIRLLTINQIWERAIRKSKVPNVVIDKQVIEILRNILQYRLEKYEHPEIEHDLEIVKNKPSGSREFNAAVLRVGEKRLLGVFKRSLDEEFERACGRIGSGKRKVEDEDGEGDGESGKRRR